MQSTSVLQFDKIFKLHDIITSFRNFMFNQLIAMHIKSLQDERDQQLFFRGRCNAQSELTGQNAVSFEKNGSTFLLLILLAIYARSQTELDDSEELRHVVFNT